MSISVSTEIPDNSVEHLNGWVLFDGNCWLCKASARYFSHFLNRFGFALAPLQTPWVQKRLGLHQGEPFAEMRLLLANGDAPGGADAIIEIARRIWWAWPFFVFANFPGVRPLLRATYRFIAANRYCANGACRLATKLRWFDWLPLVLLPVVSVATQHRMAAWVFMWILAGAIFIGCKWLTWRKAWLSGSHLNWARSLAYFFAWPGMNASEFLRENVAQSRNVSKGQWMFAFAKTLVGIALFWTAARGGFGTEQLITGWIGMLGLMLFLHFGLFEILALIWQAVGVNAKPVMRGPLAATSLAQFWSVRWNTAFTVLAHDFAFRPLVKHFGVGRVTLGVFAMSGIIHDLIISLPARAGFGLPTAYFLFQGLAVLAERSAIGRRAGLGRGFRGWLFTVSCAGGPAFWLFHPPFVKNVILPMLQAIGVN